MFTSIAIEDVENLEGFFAFLTETGWEIPGWLVNLRKHVEERDSRT